MSECHKRHNDSRGGCRANTILSANSTPPLHRTMSQPNDSSERDTQELLYQLVQSVRTSHIMGPEGKSVTFVNNTVDGSRDYVCAVPTHVTLNMYEILVPLFRKGLQLLREWNICSADQRISYDRVMQTLKSKRSIPVKQLNTIGDFVLVNIIFRCGDMLKLINSTLFEHTGHEHLFYFEHPNVWEMMTSGYEYPTVRILRLSDCTTRTLLERSGLKQSFLEPIFAKRAVGKRLIMLHVVKHMDHVAPTVQYMESPHMMLTPPIDDHPLPLTPFVTRPCLQCAQCGGRLSGTRTGCDDCLIVAYCSEKCKGTHRKTHAMSCLSSTYSLHRVMQSSVNLEDRLKFVTDIIGRGVVQSDCCEACNQTFSSLQRCGSCKKAYYCSSQCQLRDWQRHKHYCQK